MGISEFALHNVLRTYSRQERLGQVQRPKSRPTQVSASSDQVSLSRGAQKAQWLGQLAAEVVDARHPGLPPEERAPRIRAAKEELLYRHAEDVADEGLPLAHFQDKVRSTYES